MPAGKIPANGAHNSEIRYRKIYQPTECADGKENPMGKNNDTEQSIYNVSG